MVTQNPLATYRHHCVIFILRNECAVSLVGYFRAEYTTSGNITVDPHETGKNENLIYLNKIPLLLLVL